MKTITIRGKTIGSGRPKTIVPIVATTADAILAQAKHLKELLAQTPFDLIEWRADFFEHASFAPVLIPLLQSLRITLGEIPLLVTYRRTVEGGEGSATPAEYLTFCETVMRTQCADLLDVELSIGSTDFCTLTALGRKHCVPIIASSHNFAFTPSTQEMVDTLCAMQAGGAQIAKLAVMPNSKADLLALFTATATMAEQHPETPVVTMSMGSIGQASRVCGASFGSAMTFASIGTASAPGQIALPEMNLMLDALYGGATDV